MQAEPETQTPSENFIFTIFAENDAGLLTVPIEGKPVKLMIDSGASCNIIGFQTLH